MCPLWLCRRRWKLSEDAIGAGPEGCLLAHCLADTEHEIPLFDHRPPYERPWGGGPSPLVGTLFSDVMDLPFPRHQPPRVPRLGGLYRSRFPFINACGIGEPATMSIVPRIPPTCNRACTIARDRNVFLPSAPFPIIILTDRSYQDAPFGQVASRRPFPSKVFPGSRYHTLKCPTLSSGAANHGGPKSHVEIWICSSP
jgi:hypothetical protein